MDVYGNEYKYITMTLPNVQPSSDIAMQIRNSEDSTIASGTYLEQELAMNQAYDSVTSLGAGPTAKQVVYVFGQCMTEDGEYTPVGFYRNINHNWYLDPDFDNIEDEWYYRDESSDWRRNNLYVRHNRVYLLYSDLQDEPGLMPQSPFSRVMPVVFDDDADGEGAPASVFNTDDPYWYSMLGQRMAEPPTVPGIYIHQGKKVIITDHNGTMLIEH